MDCAGRRATTSQVNLYSDHLGASAAHNSWLSTAIVRSEHPRRENSGCSKKGRRARLSNGDTELRNSPMRSAADEATHVSVDMEIRVPTSVILEGLLHDAPNDQVTLNWIIDHLGARSFGIIMLIIALVGLAPGGSPFIGILLAVPAFQMMMARPAPPHRSPKDFDTRFARLLHGSFLYSSAWSASFVRVGARRSKQRNAYWVLLFCF